jgi:phospholipid-translocating ATPase
VFIRTDQLDGETDWKLRKAIKFTHNFMNKNDMVNTLSLLATVNAEEPHLDIYKFEGFFKVESNSQQEGCREGLNL